MCIDLYLCRNILVHVHVCYLYMHMYFVSACRIVERPVKRQSATPLRQEDWESIQAAAEKDTDESVVHSFGGMCEFSNEVMGQETEGAG